MVGKGWWWIPFEKKNSKKSAKPRSTTGPPTGRLPSTQQSWQSPNTWHLRPVHLRSRLIKNPFSTQRRLRQDLLGISSIRFSKWIGTNDPYGVDQVPVFVNSIPEFHWNVEKEWYIHYRGVVYLGTRIIAYNLITYDPTSSETYFHHFRKIQWKTTLATIYLLLMEDILSPPGMYKAR